MKYPILFFTCACILTMPLEAAQRFADRFVWISGWNLQKDSDITEISSVLQTAGKHHLDGAVFSVGLDTLSKQSPDFFRRLKALTRSCEDNGLELIPAVFSVGHAGGVLADDPNLAEGLPVENAFFIARGSEARFAANHPVQLRNGGFEEFDGNSFTGFDSGDHSGKASFADTAVHHEGKASLRLENFTGDPRGQSSIRQSVQVQPRRCYRVTLWVKTEGLEPAGALRIVVEGAGREIAPRQFPVAGTADWRKISMLFNSLSFDNVSISAGVWGGKAGKVWLDDWAVEEVGPVNVLQRPGTPVTVRAGETDVVYTEGKDYAPLQDPGMSPWNDTAEAIPLKLLPGSRIQDGQHLRVSWYHSMIFDDSQISVCMAEPALYKVFDQEAKLLSEKLSLRTVLLDMNEIRMGGTCKACKGHNMGKLLGECVTKQAEILRGYNPSLEIYIWSDMLDPNQNGHGDYYLVDGSFAGSWEQLPRNLIMAVGGPEPRQKSLEFFSGLGFRTLISCYYDADDLKGVEAWLNVAPQTRKFRGFMFTTSEKKYALLPAFGDLLQKPVVKPQ